MLGHVYQKKKTCNRKERWKGRGRLGRKLIITRSTRNTTNISCRCLLQRLEKQLHILQWAVHSLRVVMQKNLSCLFDTEEAGWKLIVSGSLGCRENTRCHFWPLKSCFHKNGDTYHWKWHPSCHNMPRSPTAVNLWTSPLGEMTFSEMFIRKLRK